MPGQTIYEAILAIRADTAQLRTDMAVGRSIMQSGIGQLSSIVGSLAPGLAAAFSIGGIIAFGKKIVDTAGQLKDLSDQTGISAQLLSGMKSTLEENGTTVDAFARGIFNLQKNIGQIKSSTDPALQAIQELGLNLDELVNASPEQFLKQITEALAKVESPLKRNAIGAQLMSRQFRELGPAIMAMVGHLDALKAAGMSDSDIQKLDDFGDAITRMGNAFAIAAGGPLAAFVDQMERLFQLTESGRVRDSMVRTSEEIEQIEKMLDSRKNLRSKGLGFFTVPEAQDDEALRRLKLLKERLADLGGQLGKMRGPRPAAAIPKVHVDLDKDATKKALDQAEDQTNAFIDGLQKELDQLEIKRIEVNQGAVEGVASKLDLAWDEFSKKMKAKGLPIPKGAEEQFLNLRAGIVAATQASEDAKRADEELKAQLGKGLDEEIRRYEQLRDARKELADITSKAQLSQINTLLPAGKEAQRVIELLSDAAKVIERLQQLKGVLPANEWAALDNAMESVRAATRAQIETGGELMQAVSALDQQQLEAARLSAALGLEFGLTSRSIDIQRQRIEELLKSYDALDPKVQQAVAGLRRLESEQSAQDFFKSLSESIDTGISDTLRGIMEGTQSIGDGLRNMVRNIALSISEEIAKQSLINPIKNWLMDQFKIEGVRAPSLDLGALFERITRGPATTGPASSATPRLLGPQAEPAQTLQTAATEHIDLENQLEDIPRALDQFPEMLIEKADLIDTAFGEIPDVLSNNVGALNDSFSIFNDAILSWSGELANLPSVASSLGAGVGGPDIGSMLGEDADLIDTAFTEIGAAMTQGIDRLESSGTSGFSSFFSGLGSMLSDGLSSLTSGGGFDLGGILKSWLKGNSAAKLPQTENLGASALQGAATTLQAAATTEQTSAAALSASGASLESAAASLSAAALELAAAGKGGGGGGLGDDLFGDKGAGQGGGKLGDLLEDIAPPLDQFPEMLITDAELIDEAFGEIPDVLSKNASLLDDSFSVFNDALLSWSDELSNLPSLASSLGAGGLGVGGPGLGGLQDIAPDMMSNMPDMLIKDADLIDSAFTEIGDSMTQGIDSLAGIGAEEFPSLFSGIGDAFTSGLSSLSSISLDGFSSFFSGMGSMLSEGISSLMSSIGGMFGGGGGGFDWAGMASSAMSWIGSLMFLKGGGPVRPGAPTIASELGVPSFDTGGQSSGGGLSLLHPGEFVMRQPSASSLGSSTLNYMNKTGELPPAEQPQPPNVMVQTTIQGDVIPRQPTLTRKDVIETVVQNLDNQGAILKTMEQRTSLRR